jgi:hypothetical protein
MSLFSSNTVAPLADARAWNGHYTTRASRRNASPARCRNRRIVLVRLRRQNARVRCHAHAARVVGPRGDAGGAGAEAPAGRPTMARYIARSASYFCGTRPAMPPV